MGATAYSANPIVSGYPDFIMSGETRKRVDTHFRVWLQIARVFDDPNLSEIEKCIYAINLSGIEHTDTLADIAGIQKFLAAEPDSSKHRVRKGPRTFDYDVDYGRIVASFQSDYGIDITDRECSMHWWRFVDLLRNLSNATALMRAIEIRTMPLPEGRDEHSSKRREAVIAAKRELALPSKGLEEMAAKDRALWGE